MNEMKNTDIVAFVHPCAPYGAVSEAAKRGGHLFVFAETKAETEALRSMVSPCLNKIDILQVQLFDKSVKRGVSVSLDDFFENERVDWLFCAKNDDLEVILAGASKVIAGNFEGIVFEENETYVIYKRDESIDARPKPPIEVRRYSKEALREYLDNCQIDEPAGGAVVKLLTRAALGIDTEQNISCVIEAVMQKEISFEEVLEITRHYIWEPDTIYALLTENIKKRKV